MRLSLLGKDEMEALTLQLLLTVDDVEARTAHLVETATLEVVDVLLRVVLGGRCDARERLWVEEESTNARGRSGRDVGAVRIERRTSSVDVEASAILGRASAKGVL